LADQVQGARAGRQGRPDRNRGIPARVREVRRRRAGPEGAGGMSETTLRKAKLIELKEDLSSELDGGKQIDVQFNPDTLKVTYANQVVQPEGGDQAAGTAGRQFV